jgi:hypothetical protein
MNEQRLQRLEDKVDRISENAIRLTTIIENTQDHEKRITAIEMERAKESTPRNLLNKYWWVVALFVGGVEPALLLEFMR